MNRNLTNQDIPYDYKKANHYIIPKHWDDYVIGDIVDFSGGAQPPRSEFINNPKEGYIRLIQIRDYKTDDYLTYIPIEKARKLCDETDVMIGRYGPPIFQILRGIKGAYNVALIKAIPNEKKLLKDYMFYYLKNETLYNLIDRLSRRSSGQTGIDINALNNFPFPLPPIREQERIVTIIKKWDKVIELNEKLVEQKELQKKGLIQNLLKGKLRLEDIGKYSKEELQERLSLINKGQLPIGYKKSKFGALPNNWNVMKLKDIISPNTHEVDKPKEGYWRLGLRSHAKGTFHEFIEDPSKVSMDKLYKVEADNLIVNITFAWEHAIAVTSKEDIGKLVSHRFPTYKFKKIAHPQFYKYYVFQSHFKYLLDNISPGGAGRNRVLSKKDFLNLEVLVPPIDEQEYIANILLTADNEISCLKSKLNYLKQQKKGLMQLLLTGKIRVKV